MCIFRVECSLYTPRVQLLKPSHLWVPTDDVSNQVSLHGYSSRRTKQALRPRICKSEGRSYFQSYHIFLPFLRKKKGNGKKRKTKRIEKGSISEVISSLGDSSDTRELKQPRQRRQQKPTNLHIWQWKTVSLHALHLHFSSFDILKTFSFFLRREMTCFAVVWTTWAYDDKCSILSSYFPSAGSNFIPGYLTHFSSMITLNNWKMIAETRSYIFRWRSRFCHRRVCLTLPFYFRELKQPQRRQPLERQTFAYLTKTKLGSFARFAPFTRAFFIFVHFAVVLVLSMTWNQGV